MKKPVVLFDMDGTLCDYAGGLAKSFNEIRCGTEKRYKSSDFGFQKGMPKWMKSRRNFITANGDWWLDLKPLELGIKLFEIAGSIGFRRVICTKGPFDKPHAWSNKMIWCRKQLSIYSDVSVTITEDKSLVYGAILVDDWPEYILPWLQVRPRGMVLLPNQPWNQNFEHERVCRLTKSPKSMSDAIEVLKRSYRRVMLTDED